MKKFYLSFIFSLIGLLASAQGTIQLTVRWNAIAARYEVYAKPSFTLNNFNWGPSQISVVVPNSAPDASLIVTSIAAGAWSDNSKVYAPSALPTNDFHGVESNGAQINLIANTESLIFTFTFPDGQCRDGIRLFVNNVDPGSSAGGMNGGDFRNSISNAVLEDVYISNYANTGTFCNPIANPDGIIPTTAGELKNIQVLTNDKNGDGTSVTDLSKISAPTITTQPTKGTVTVKVDGTVDYTPNLGTSGTDTFIYQICDKVNTTVCDTAKVTVSITPVIVANPDGIIPATAGILKNIPVLTNDKNTDNTSIVDLSKTSAPTITTQPTKGTVTVKADGSIDYTPNVGTSGTDTFIYQICDKVNTTVCDTAKVTVSITPVIVANPDGIIPATAGILKNIPVLTNDKNTDNTSIVDLSKTSAPTITTQPTKGTVTVKADGSIDYTPNVGTSGTDTFIYQICDKVNTTVCDTAKVTVSITPVIVANPDGIIPATAGILKNIPVLTNDKNTDNTSIVDLSKTSAPTITTQPTKGTVTVKADGSIDYTPNVGTSGTDTFIYQICDKVFTSVCDTARVTIAITPVIVANPDGIIPATAGILENIPVLTNDKNTDNTSIVDLSKTSAPTITTQPTKGTVTVKADGSIDYTPNVGTSGTDTFIYQICDKVNTTVCDTAKVTIAITPVIVANPDGIIPATAGVLKNIPVLTNDKNTDNTSIVDLSKTSAPTITTQPTKGTVTVKADGSIDYTPNVGTSGTDTFIYQICDKVNTTVCDTAKVTIAITPVIVANPDGIIPATAGILKNIPVLTNDKNTDNTSIVDLSKTSAPTITTQPTKGTVTVKADGSIDYTPNVGTSGTDTFIYQICDKVNTTVCDTAKVTVSITPPPPIFNPDFNVTYVNVLVEGNVNTNDVNVPVSSIYGTPKPSITNPSTCLPIISANGSYTFICSVPGVFSFTVPVCPLGVTINCPEIPLVITVKDITSPSNNGPVANTDITSTLPNSPVTLKSLVNDASGNTYVTLNPASVVVTKAPKNGTTSVNLLTGNITYTPNSGFIGNDTLTYKVCDSAVPAKCANALQIITILPLSEPNTTAAADDYSQTDVNIPVSGNVSTNDYDPQGQQQSVVPQNSTFAGKGTLGLSADGSFTFTPVTGFTGPVEFIYTTCDNGSPQACANATLHILVSPPLLAKLNIKVLLQGALLPSASNTGVITTGIMRDNLRTAGVIPLTEPYTAIGTSNARFTHVGGGGETTSLGVLSATGNDAIVDWVFIELRDSNNPSTVIKTKSALVQRDGDVVDASDGVSAITFTGIVDQSYYVSVKHRNHLGAMTSTALLMTTTGTTVDFTSMTASQLYNNASQYDGYEQVDVNGKKALWAGNTNVDNKVKYVGVNNDQIPVFSQVLGYVNNMNQQYNYDFVTPVYLSGDVNMDAKVKYRGPNNDPAFIFYNVITKYADLNSASLYNYDLFIEQLP